MASKNLVILIGRLGQDPELKYTQSGTPVCTFSVATSDKWKDKNTGEWQEKTEWHNIVAWKETGERCAEYLHKGSQVYIEGKLQTDKFESEGVTKYYTKINAMSVQFLDPKREESRQSDRVVPPMDSILDDDIPF